MAYDESADAAESLDTPEVEDESSGETFFIPKQGDYKPGDTFEVRVVGETAEGELEVECVHPGGKEKPWQDDMRDTMKGGF